ncbi:MAG: ATP-binding cassette domain-containing protein [Nitrospirae bacterium]|nr:ATP-binding cassette domain-containing protein [Nitrospirota bacterium]
MKAIETSNFKKTFGEKTVVDNLTLDVEKGEVFGLLGPNGAGKTTTIRTILTLLKPTEGQVRVWGHDVVTQPREVRQVLGYVPQEKAVDRFLTGREHLILVADLYHLTRPEAKKRIEEVLALVDLTQKADDLVNNYSGGMKKKLDIACGLIPNPNILVMDEPTLGLDVESRIRVWDYIRRLQRGGLTILMTTNYLDEADQLCDRIAILDRGRLAALGPPEGLKKGLGGDRVTIQLGPHQDGLDELAGSLKKELPFVNAIKISPASHELEIRVTSNEEALAPLIQKINGHNRPIVAIQYSRPTLEDVFITYTGHKIKEDSALL